MPRRSFRSRATGRRRTFRRRAWRRFTRTYKRAGRRPRVHSFKRVAMLTPLQIGEGVAVPQTYSFKLSDLSNYSEFTNLFDQYRINAVKLQLVPTFSGNDIDYQTIMGSIHSAIDHNDITNPTSVGQLMEYDTYKRSKQSRGHKRYFKVNLLSNLSGDAGNVTTWKKWIDTASPNAPYYGIKLMLDPLNSTDNDKYATFEVYATFYFQCKSVI